MGNGLSVYNRLELVDGDYARVAHIQPDRTVTFYHNNLPQEIREQIEFEARTSEVTVSATQDTPVFTTPPQPIDVAIQGAEWRETDPIQRAGRIYRDTAETLAADLTSFYRDYDQYGYDDAVDDPEQAVAELEETIERGGAEFEGIRTELAEIGNEAPEHAPATNALIERLTNYAALNHNVGLNNMTLEGKAERIAQRFEGLMDDIRLYEDGLRGRDYRPETDIDRAVTAEQVESIKADVLAGNIQQYIDLLESVKTGTNHTIIQEARCELLIRQFKSVAAELEGLRDVQEATTPEREQPDRTRGVPKLELGVQVADTTITPEQKAQFDTITDGTLLPLNKDRAVELYQQDQPIYLVDGKGETMMVLDEQEIIQGCGHVCH